MRTVRTSDRTLSLCPQPYRVMTVTSGKGGVGKSNIVVNLAMALNLKGKHVLIMDADLGLANIDILLGLDPIYNINHVLAGEKKIDDIIVNGPGSIGVIPASSGTCDLLCLTDEQKLAFIDIINSLANRADIILIDTSSGISDNVIFFNLAANERIIVITPDPASLLDAYALIKILHHHGERNVGILMNIVKDENEGNIIFSEICRAANMFLDAISIDFLGSIPYDPSFSKSVLLQKPILELYPEAAASRAFRLLARNILAIGPPNHGMNQFHWRRLLNT